MHIQIKDVPNNNVVEVHVAGKLTAEEYKQFAPQFDHCLAENGKFGCCSKCRTFPVGKQVQREKISSWA